MIKNCIFSQRRSQKKIVLISEIVFKLWIIEIFILASEVKFNLGGQSSFLSKVAYLTKGYCRKNLILISEIASELWMFEIFNLTSEVKFDLGGQSSWWSKVAYLDYELTCNFIYLKHFYFGVLIKVYTYNTKIKYIT